MSLTGARPCQREKDMNKQELQNKFCGMKEFGKAMVNGSRR